MGRKENSNYRMGRLIKMVGRQFIPNLGTLLLVALLLWAQQAGAFQFAMPRPQAAAVNALPEMVTYQGKLTDALGNPIDVDTAMTFALYTVPSGGTALWSESYSGGNMVPVREGEFTIQLGSINPLPAGFWENPELYLGITVGTDSEMSPREKISAVPQAAQAGLALQALTVPDGAIGSRHIQPTIFQAQLSNDMEVPPGGQQVVLELTVDFPITATYVFFISLNSKHDEADNRIQAKLLDDSGADISTMINNSHPVAGNEGSQSGALMAVYDLGAGPHVLQLVAWNGSSTASGYARGGTQVIAIPFYSVP